jgi:tripartite-type tricarboxylate transporter receptor subunit TctC
MNRTDAGRRATLVALLAAAAGRLDAQPRTDGSYPSRPVRWIVPFAPGAANDVIARLFAKGLGDRLGQSFVVENRAGAGGSIGAAAVAGAPPDGYTLLLSNPGPNVGTPMLSKDASYGVDAFASVVAFGQVPLIVVAHPSFPANDPAGLLAWLRANPGKANWGSSGNLSNPHIALELFKLVTGTSIAHVPYKGSGPALNDLVAGQIQLLYTSLASVEGHISGGRLKVLGAASSGRLAALPEVPTLQEAGITGADAATWFGLSVRAGTPPEIIATLNAACNALLQTDDMRSRLQALGVTPIGGPPSTLERYVQRDVTDLRRLIDARVFRTD